LCVVAEGITVVVGPVIASADVFTDLVTSGLGDLVRLAGIFVWVLAHGSVVTASIDGKGQRAREP
jgi:hypothetical protein